MLYASILILIIFFIVYIISVKSRNEALLKNLDKKEHKLYALYPMAAFLLGRTGLEKILSKPETVYKIRAVYVSGQEENQTRLYLYKKLSLILLLVIAFSFFSLILSLQHIGSSPDSFDGTLTRPENKEGDENIRLKFQMESKTHNNDVYEDEIVIPNHARALSQKEWEEVLKEAIPYLEQEMLGINKSLNYVYSDLNFLREIPETGISVDWIPDDYRLVSERGAVRNTDITEKINTKVTAVLEYRDRRVEHTIPLTIWPAVIDHKDKLYQDLLKVIDETDKATGSNNKWTLPEELGDYIIKWEKPESNSAGSVLLLGLFAAVLVWLIFDRDLENGLKRRNNQMLQDYPEIINKFCLLVNAGMTIKQAWFNISEDYIEKKNDRKGGKRHEYMRYAYEEMTVTLYELKLGIPEAQAFDQFGRRTGLLPYMKFSSLLVQNLKKGNKDMVNLLKLESVEAFHERKDAAKKLGEEASTKLLAPMIIMLFIVLIIIMIPAFISFSI